MAFDDIVKALTVQITADDLTGGAWSSVGKGVKEVWNNVTALNQAWELGAKAYGVISDVMAKPIAALSSGGEYAEAEAGMKSLAESYKVDGQKIVDTILNVSESTVGLMEATQASSNAIKKGFSEDQITLLAEFSKKYSDTVGGDFLTILADIEKSISTGNAKAAKSYDLPIEKGMEWTKVQDIIKKKMDSMGEGAYNFGDQWKGMLVGVENIYTAVDKELNNLLGETGFPGMVKSITKALIDVKNNASTIATGIFYITKDLIQAVASPISDFFDIIFDSIGDTSKETKSAADAIKDIVIGVGNTVYDVSIAISNVFNFLMKPLDSVLTTTAKSLSVIIHGMVKVNEITGFYSKENTETLKGIGATLAEVYNTGLLKIDVDSIIKKQEIFNKKVLESGSVAKEASKEHANMSEGLKRVGQEFETTETKVKNQTTTMEKYIASLKEAAVLNGVEVQYGGLTPTSKKNGVAVWEFDQGMNVVTGNGKSGSSSTTAQNAIPKSSQQVIKVQVEGKDGAMKELIEEIIERVTTKAIAEGLITAGV